MEREANYAAVGGFVVLIALLAGLFVYWYAGVREHRDYRRYEIYFDGSVSGLSDGGSVRYLGVEVGRVVRIRLERKRGIGKAQALQSLFKILEFRIAIGIKRDKHYGRHFFVARQSNIMVRGSRFIVH